MNWTSEYEDSVDYAFLKRVANEVTQSCALPFVIPVERIPEFICQASQWFFENVNDAVEERLYIVKNSDICKEGHLNKIVQLPQQIIGVHGVFKIQEHMKYGAMGDFSLERMMISSFNSVNGIGSIGVGGFSNGGGYTLEDVVVSMYEVDSFSQYLNPPVTFSFNSYSSKLNIIGDLGYSDILLDTMVRCRIQDLYNNYYFFRLVVCFVKRALSTILGTYEFKLPGGITINYDKFTEQANDDYEEIKEWAERNRVADYFFMPNQL
jgi:hypothetical protein